MSDSDATLLSYNLTWCIVFLRVILRCPFSTLFFFVYCGFLSLEWRVRGRGLLPTTGPAMVRCSSAQGIYYVRTEWTLDRACMKNASDRWIAASPLGSAMHPFVSMGSLLGRKRLCAINFGYVEYCDFFIRLMMHVHLCH
jgi:hypothetical protein